MKNLFMMGIFSIAMCFALSPSFAKEKKVDFHLTTTGGCDVHVQGTVEYTVLPPAITAFHGTVKIGPPCTVQTLTFAMIVPGGGGTSTDMTVEFDNTEDICSISSVTWSGDNPYVTLLNSPEAVSTLITQIQEEECL